MRDIERIAPFCEKLERYWKEMVPDWRFGQLMSNFLGYVAQKKGDIWFVEEPEMSELLDEYFASNK